MPKTAEPAQEILPPPLARTLRVDELKDGEGHLIEVNGSGREAIASLLDLIALDRLSFAFLVHRRGQGRLALQGTLAASVTQTCVVSLEPVASTLAVPVEIEFWPLHLSEDRAVDEATARSIGQSPSSITRSILGLSSTRRSPLRSIHTRSAKG